MHCGIMTWHKVPTEFSGLDSSLTFVSPSSFIGAGLHAGEVMNMVRAPTYNSLDRPYAEQMSPMKTNNPLPIKV